MLNALLSSMQRIQSKTALGFSKSQGLFFAFLPWLQFLASALIVAFALRLEPTDKQCRSRSFSWSPATQAIRYHWETFSNIGLFTDSPFFGLNQTDEIEQAWIDILPVHPIAIPESRISDLNHSLDGGGHWVRDPSNPASLLAVPEVFVQLDCLNFIRQLSHSDQRDYTDLPVFQIGNASVWHRAHQCIERLRQNVMCWADTSPILQEINPDPPLGSEGQLLFRFDSYHRCRDFNRIKAWTDDHAVHAVETKEIWARH